MSKNKVSSKPKKGEIDQYAVFVTDPDEMQGGTPPIRNHLYYGNKDPLPKSIEGGIDTLKKIIE